MKQIKLSDWKIRNKNFFSKGLSSTYRVQEKVRYRDFKIDDKRILEEGIILEHLDKNITMKEKEYKPSQQHLIGYHYLSIIKDGKDEFWIQGNIKENKYAIFEDDIKVVFNWNNKRTAFKRFKEELKKRYKVEL